MAFSKFGLNKTKPVFAALLVLIFAIWFLSKESVESLFTGCAFWGLLLTLEMQWRESRKQEYARQKDQLERHFFVFNEQLSKAIIQIKFTDIPNVYFGIDGINNAYLRAKHDGRDFKFIWHRSGHLVQFASSFDVVYGLVMASLNQIEKMNIKRYSAFDRLLRTQLTENGIALLWLVAKYVKCDPADVLSIERRLCDQGVLTKVKDDFKISTS